MDIRSHSDGGTPVTISMPDGPHAAIYREIAAAVINRVDIESASVGAAVPSIVFE